MLHNIEAKVVVHFHGDSQVSERCQQQSYVDKSEGIMPERQ
jgi:hypothetical protein